jgi:hypothetical protein
MSKPFSANRATSWASGISELCGLPPSVLSGLFGRLEGLLSGSEGIEFD